MSLQDTALNTVNLAYQPQLDALAAAAAKAEADYAQRTAAIASLYGGLGGELGGIGATYEPAASSIANGYIANLGSVAGLFGGSSGDMAGSEVSAGNALGSAIGQTTMGLLSEGSQRNLNYNSSAIRQGGIDNTNTQKSLATDLQQYLDNVSLQRTQVEAQKAMAIRDELQRLRELRFQQNMAQKQFALQRRSANQTYRMNQFQLNQARQAAAASRSGGGPGGGGPSTTTAKTPLLDSADRSALVKAITTWRAGSNMPNSLHAARMDIMTRLRNGGGLTAEELQAAYNFIGNEWLRQGGAPLPRDAGTSSSTSPASGAPSSSTTTPSWLRGIII